MISKRQGDAVYRAGSGNDKKGQFAKKKDEMKMKKIMVNLKPVKAVREIKNTTLRDYPAAQRKRVESGSEKRRDAAQTASLRVFYPE